MCGYRSGFPDRAFQELLAGIRIYLHHDRIRDAGVDPAAAERLLKLIPALLYDDRCYRRYLCGASCDRDSGLYRFPCG